MVAPGALRQVLSKWPMRYEGCDRALRELYQNDNRGSSSMRVARGHGSDRILILSAGVTLLRRSIELAGGHMR
jgi:hypothetical protein